MRTGGSDFIDASAMADEDSPVDWLNLPPAASAVSLWDSLHDGHFFSIRSNLLERTMDLFCEIEHLNKFHKLDEGFQFILHLEGGGHHECFATQCGRAGVRFHTDSQLKNSER
jgi:hypothetical protein